MQRRTFLIGSGWAAALFVYLPATAADEDAVDARLPVPGEAAQKKSSAAIREIHRADFQAARTPQGLRTLARKLLREAGESQNDPIARYSLYTVARDTALEAGDLPLALEA